MNLSSATFEFGRITQNNGHYAAAITPFKFINVTDFGNNRKLMCDFLHVLVILTYILFLIIVSALLQTIGQICAFDRGYLSLTARSG